MLYCPNCNAFQHDPDSDICPKCGFDMKAYVEKRRMKREPADAGEKRIRMVGFDEKLPCPLCGSPSKVIDSEMEFIHEGERINVHGLKLMGGEITKRTQTQYQLHVRGTECEEGHLLYEEAKGRIRALCPLCFDPMIEYGSSLLSCTRCNRHYSKADWTIPPIDDIMRAEGWQRIP